MYADGCENEWRELPQPELPITVGIDGGYIHSSPLSSLLTVTQLALSRDGCKILQDGLKTIDISRF